MDPTSTATKRKTPDEQSPPKDSSKKRTKKVQVQRSATPEICVTCNKEAKKEAIICEWCRKWEHRACAGLSIEEYDMLTTSSDQIMFFCTMCYTKVSFALRVEDENTTKLQSVENKLSEKINNIEAKLLELHNAVKNTHITDPSSVDRPSHESISDTVTNITLSLASEQKEKEKRKFNVILHNLSESNAADGSAKKQDDINRCSSLFSTYLNVTVAITNAIRIGKRDSRPCRLLKLTFSSLEEKANVLKQKLKFKLDKNPENVRKIFVTPDLTPLEQKKNNALRRQLSEMNQVQNIYAIRNGEIVRKNRNTSAGHDAPDPDGGSS